MFYLSPAQFPNINLLIVSCLICLQNSVCLKHKPTSILLGSPKLQPLFFPHNVKSGLSTKTICTIERGEKPLSFKWKHNNKDIVNSSSPIMINTFLDYTLLVIDPVSSKHGGNYTCIVRNSKGEDSFTAALVVQGILFVF